MGDSHCGPPDLRAVDPATRAFRDDVLAGLADDPPSIPCKYLYDSAGAELFDRICACDAYYPTRTELDILREHGAEIADAIPAGRSLIEPGSGSGQKTRLLLQALRQPAGYLAIDIAAESLQQSARALREDFPRLPVTTLAADFTAPLQLPDDALPDAPRSIFFPGSTIGNFERDAAIAFLQRLAVLAGSDGQLLIGIDLDKDPAVLERAYNDEDGLSAAFNRNLLVRSNRELGADFDLDAWRHEAPYDRAAQRIEMRLLSERDQTVTLHGRRFAFAEGAFIRSEYSHKYRIEDFTALAAAAGWRVERHWSDPRDWFAVVLLRC